MSQHEAYTPGLELDQRIHGPCSCPRGALGQPVTKSHSGSLVRRRKGRGTHLYEWVQLAESFCGHFHDDLHCATHKGVLCDLCIRAIKGCEHEMKCYLVIQRDAHEQAKPSEPRESFPFCLCAHLRRLEGAENPFQRAFAQGTKGFTHLRVSACKQ